jgi:hypothetical protein
VRGDDGVGAAGRPGTSLSAVDAWGMAEHRPGNGDGPVRQRDLVGCIPWGLLGWLGLALAVEGFVAGRAADLTPGNVWEWRQAGRSARRGAVEADVLCLGDSQVKNDLLPRVLEARSGRRAYNLAMTAGQAPATYFQLRRVLRAGAQPSALIVSFKPHLLMSDRGQSLRAWPELLDLDECLDLAWTARDSGFFATVALGRLLPSLRARGEVREGVLAALRGASASHGWEVAVRRRNIDANRGAVVLTRDPQYTGQVGPWGVHLYPTSWRCDPVNEAYLGRLLDLAQRRGLPVHWLLPPVCPEAQAGRERCGADVRFLQFVRRVRDRYPELVILDARTSGYSAPLFHDPIHLNRGGAAALSAAVAAVLRHPPEGESGPARWVTLPAPREWPGRAPIEDVGESILAVRASDADPSRR